jgi:hypothetical protein
MLPRPAPTVPLYAHVAPRNWTESPGIPIDRLILSLKSVWESRVLAGTPHAPWIVPLKMTALVPEPLTTVSFALPRQVTSLRLASSVSLHAGACSEGGTVGSGAVESDEHAAARRTASINV